MKIRRPLCLAVLVWVGILSILLRAGMVKPDEGYDELKGLIDGQNVILTGKVSRITGAAPDQTYYIDHVRFEMERAADPDTEKKENSNDQISPDTYAGEIFLSVPAYYKVAVRSGEGAFPAPGDTPEPAAASIACDDLICVSGTVTFPSAPTNPGQFDDQAYCRSRDILFRIYDGEITLEKEGVGLRRFLQKIRDLAGAGYASSLSEEEAAVLTGITLGDSSEVSNDTKNLFREGGIAHILAISALHVNLLALSLYHFLRRRAWPFPLCGAASLVLLGAYVIMTGVSTSAVRAFVMFAIWCLAQSTGRKADVPTSAAAAAGILTVWHPTLLMDSGFWLSFGCVISLYCLPDLLLEYLTGRKKRKRENRILRAFISSVSVTLGTLPICSYFFYQITPWSFLINLAILPCMSILFAFGCLGSLLGNLSVFAGRFVLSVCHYLLLFFLLLCRLERKLPFGVWITGRPAMWQIILYYVALTGALGRKRAVATAKSFVIGKTISDKRISKKKVRPEKRTQKQAQPGLPVLRGLLLFLTCVLIIKFRIFPGWRMAVMDVGQGDCILIQLRERSFLIDCGSSSVRNVWSRRVSPCLKYYGITHLDGVFVSHGDSDHIIGLQDLIGAYERNLLGENCGDVSIDAMFVSGAATPASEPALDTGAAELEAAALEKRIPVRRLMPGDKLSVRKDALYLEKEDEEADRRLRSGEWGKITCLYPSGEDVASNGPDANQNSMVLVLETSDKQVWLMGDLEKAGEMRLISMLRERRETEAAGGEDVSDAAGAAQVEADGYGQRNDIPEGSRQVILKVGHHGSANATAEELLRLLRPDLAVISCGRNNRFGHPAQATLLRLHRAGAFVRRTDMEGAVILEQDLEYRFWRH